MTAASFKLSHYPNNPLHFKPGRAQPLAVPKIDLAGVAARLKAMPFPVS